MSNQPKAHVADERAAFEFEMRKGYGEEHFALYLEPFEGQIYRSTSMNAAWNGWQAARAAIPAGADVAVAIQMPNTEQVRDLMRKAKILESQCWIADVLKVEEVIRSVIAAGAPAETPKQGDAHEQAVKAGFAYEYDDKRGVHHYRGEIEQIERLLAAQPAPAPATDARTVVPEPSRAARIECALRALIDADDAQALDDDLFNAGRSALAMLSANSPREAG